MTAVVRLTTEADARRAASLQDAMVYLAGQLVGWTHQDRLPALDRYLVVVRRKPRAGSLPQYREFRDTVKTAAEILRPPEPAAAGRDPETPPASAPPLGELSEENERRFRAVFSDPDDAGAQWRFAVDVPGPVAGVAPPASPGPGTQDES